MKKENSITLQPEVATSVKVSNPFSWTTVQKFYNSLPLEITPCESIYEAKMYTAALLAVLSIAFLPLVVVALFVYNSAKKGGQR